MQPLREMSSHRSLDICVLVSLIYHDKPRSYPRSFPFSPALVCFTHQRLSFRNSCQISSFHEALVPSFSFVGLFLPPISSPFSHVNYAAIPKPGSMPACFKAFAFLESTVFLSAFCCAASVLTCSTGANLTPRGVSSRSRSTVAQIVTFSPLMVMRPGSLTSWISHAGSVGEVPKSGLRAAIRSWHSVRTRLAVKC